MSKVLNSNQQMLSRQAISDYKNNGHWGVFQADIKIKKNGKFVFNKKCQVTVSQNSYSECTIQIDLPEEYYTEYVPVFQVFKYSAGVLSIEAEDRQGSKIEIMLS